MSMTDVDALNEFNVGAKPLTLKFGVKGKYEKLAIALSKIGAEQCISFTADELFKRFEIENIGTFKAGLTFAMKKLGKKVGIVSKAVMIYCFPRM